jgi:hypothetical protein
MKINLNIPQSWNELNQKQFEKIALLFSTVEPSQIRDIKLLKILVGAKWWQLKKKANLRLFLFQVPYSEWKGFIEFLLKENNRTNFIPVIKVGNKTYFAPADRIQNLNAEEFAVADDLHIRFRETKNPEYLQYLFHVLYSETEERKPFDKNKLEKQINKKIPMATLVITEMTYFGCKNYIANKFKKAFPKSTKKETGPRKGFGKIIQAMAKGDLSKLPIIERTNIYKFMQQFQDDIEEYNKQKTKK